MKHVKGNKKGIIKGITIIIFWALMVTGALAQAQAQEGTENARRQFEIEPLLKIDNPQAEFKVDLWTDREDGTYPIGDKVTFFFKADRDCRVTLLNVGSDGKVQLLFPNDFHKENLVKAGMVYTIPPKESKFAIRAKAPAGVDTIKAIATLDKVVLIRDEDIIPIKGFIKGFKGINKNVRTLTIELEETLKPVDPKTWAEAQRVVKIVPKVGD